jgi:tetratricopeptide (TPR) repeat protein
MVAKNDLRDKIRQEFSSLVQQASYYCKQKNLSKALECYEKAEELGRGYFPKSLVLGGLLNDEGVTLFKIGYLDRAILMFAESFEIKKNAGATGGTIACTLMNLGGAYRANCEYEKALSTLAKVKTWAEQYNKGVWSSISKREIIKTESARDKKPLIHMPSVKLGFAEGTCLCISSTEHLPNVFKDLVAKVDYIHLTSDSKETTLAISFTVFGKIPEGIYAKEEEWKKQRAPESVRLEDASPNLIVFMQKHETLIGKTVKLLDEEAKPLKFDQNEAPWVVAIPDSYPFGGFMPLPICEKFMYFSGFGNFFYWKLSSDAKYIFEATFTKNVEDEPLQLGLLLPFKKVIIPIWNLTVEAKQETSIEKGFLKQITYHQKKTSLVEEQYINFNQPVKIFELSGEHIYKMKGAAPAETLEFNDFTILGFEFFPKRINFVKKFDVFPFLKADPLFRAEAGETEYVNLVEKGASIPEKCEAHPTGAQCKSCSMRLERMCVVNVIGVLCGSEILPHHGFEYSDLLLKVNSSKTPFTIPVIIKGPEKLTWKNDGNLYKQTLDKLQDSKVSVLVLAMSGQVDNELRIHLENLADSQKKSLIFLDSKDLAQFIYRIGLLSQRRLAP